MLSIIALNANLIIARSVMMEVTRTHIIIRLPRLPTSSFMTPIHSTIHLDGHARLRTLQAVRITQMKTYLRTQKLYSIMMEFQISIFANPALRFIKPEKNLLIILILFFLISSIL
jgi:hypothetical protein